MMKNSGKIILILIGILVASICFALSFSRPAIQTKTAWKFANAGAAHFSFSH
jgi:hypothetical protein